MPKVGMEPIRRSALVQATIEEIGAAQTLDVTVGQIAKRAGMSTALAHHYFGGKDQIFLAAMRHILREYGAEVRARLADARPVREPCRGDGRHRAYRTMGAARVGRPHRPVATLEGPRGSQAGRERVGPAAAAS